LNLLITGGTGALGRHVVARAAAAGHTLRVLTRQHGVRVDQIRGDLMTGDGLDAAVAGINAVVHLASDPRHAAAVDVEGTRRLLAASSRAGVGHFLYMSIVGVDVIPYAYYQRKLEAERLVESSGIPYSIVRATQFHSLVDTLLTALARVPLVMPLPKDVQFQSVAEEDVAERLLRTVGNGPLNGVVNFGGPEIMRLEAMAYAWRTVRGHRKLTFQLPVPGTLARAFRDGRNTVSSPDRGTIRWSDWLGGSW
jgi:uncharacterized protein YbjT (DUF2867 family)